MCDGPDSLNYKCRNNLGHARHAGLAMTVGCR